MDKIIGLVLMMLGVLMITFESYLLMTSNSSYLTVFNIVLGFCSVLIGGIIITIKKEVLMANISDFTKGGAFLKADDIKSKPNEKFKITGEGKTEKSEKFGNMRLKIPGMFGVDEKVFDCNKTNARAIEKALGTSETDQWIGAELLFDIIKTRLSDGKIVDSLDVKSISKK